MIELLWIVVSGIFVGMMSAWTLTLLRKWGIIEWLQVSITNKTFNELVSCYYCMSWWLSVVMSAAMAIALNDGWLLFGAFVATMTSLKMLS